MEDFKKNIENAVELLKKSKYIIAFTGAGISVESGIAPFRGKGGLYEKVSDRIFDLDYFYINTKNCWYLLLKFILIPLLKAQPNEAHYSLSNIEKHGFIKSIITQNIDSLHEKAESKDVIKFHGSADSFSCTRCKKKFQFNQLFSDDFIKRIEDDKYFAKLIEKDFISEKDITEYQFDSNFTIPKCDRCGSIIKPDIVFFKEPIPEAALNASFYHAENSDCLLIIGTSGVVYPAAMIPKVVKRNNGKIIEINPEPSEYTYSITDIFIKSSASLALSEISQKLIKKDL